MNGAPSDSHRWTLTRTWAVVALVFAVQFGLILWLAGRTPITPAPLRPAPALRIAGPYSAEEMALTDPTLFALPHSQGFSGLAWLNIPAQAPQFYTWTNPSRWLDVPLEAPGAGLHRFVTSNPINPLAAVVLPSSELPLPRPPPMQVLPQQSTLQLANDLAGRRLLTPCDLPSITATNLLTNTIVRLVVDAEGRPVSSVLLSRSGSAKADDQALALARSMSFAPLADPVSSDSLAGLTWGEAIFTWHSLFEPPTNSPASE
jgi:hypothetical protein